MYTEQLKQQSEILAKHPKFRENGILIFRIGEKYVCIGEFAPLAAQLVGCAEFTSEEVELVIRAFVAKGLKTALIEPLNNTK